MESDLLGSNTRKLLPSPKRKTKKVYEDILNVSMEKVSAIEKSMKILNSIDSHVDEMVEVSGDKLNKLWTRLTGVEEQLYNHFEVFYLTKQNIAQFYEDAKELVLQSDIRMLLENSKRTVEIAEASKVSDENKDEASDFSTMNSIANIETEEEYPGTFPLESEIFTTTENDEEAFLDQKNPSQASVDAAIKDVSAAHVTTPTIDNATFQIRPNRADGLDLHESTSNHEASEMDIEQDSIIQTEPLVSVDNSSADADADGFIIPEVNVLKMTDMDENRLIEDISFPNLELSMSFETAQHHANNRNDLSTISERTEYEQSHESSGEEISSDIASHTSTSEPLNSEIEKRLISINDSMEEINEAFNKIPIINATINLKDGEDPNQFKISRSPSSVTFSTDKASEISEILVFSSINSESTIETVSKPITPISNVLVDEVSGRKQDDGLN